MQRMSAIYLCLAAVASALAGCTAPPLYQTAALDGPPHYSVYWGSFPDAPPDYSPDYTTVPVVGPNGKTRWVLVPKACLVPDPTEPPLLGPHLPPGCANAYNLQRMAERKSDLVRGRALGAAPAAPTARAAQEYIYGNKSTLPGTLGGGLPRTTGSQPTAPGAQSESEKATATH
jgi:hypothetical protein